MLYHASPAAGLRQLSPRLSSHGKPYVYAVDSLVTGLLFGAKQDDFDLMLFTDRQGRPVVCECYPDALPTVYQGKSCSIYLVSEEGFLRGVTGWAPELVCETAVPVLQELRVDDLYRRLLEEEQAGRVTLRRYRHTPAYRKLVASHITDRLIRFDIDPEHCMEREPRFAAHYPELIRALAAVMDGHLLP